MTTYLEDFETSNVQHTNEVNAFQASGESFITLDHQPAEHTVIDSLGHGAHRVVALVNVHPLSYELSADFDLWFCDVVIQISTFQSHHRGYIVTGLFRKEISYGYKVMNNAALQCILATPCWHFSMKCLNEGFMSKGYFVLHHYRGAIGLCLLLAAPLLELQLTKVHDSSSELVDVLLISHGKAKDVKGFL